MSGATVGGLSEATARTWHYLQLRPEAPIGEYSSLRRWADTVVMKLGAANEAETGEKLPLFCVRQNEDGYHVRVRLYGSPGQFLDWAHTHASWLAHHIGAPQVSTAWLPPYPDNPAIRMFDYAPEYAKYGSAEVLQAVEAYLVDATGVAAVLLEYESRLGVMRGQAALEMLHGFLGPLDLSSSEAMLVLDSYWRYWSPSDSIRRQVAEALNEHYGKHREGLHRRFDPKFGSCRFPCAELAETANAWRGRSAALWRRLRTLEAVGHAPSGVAGYFASSLARRRDMGNLRSYPVCALHWMPNLFHMLCNVLGIEPWLEQQLVYLMYRLSRDFAGGDCDPIQLVLEPEYFDLTAPNTPAGSP